MSVCNILQNAIAHNDKDVPDDQQDDIFGKGEKDLDSSGTGIGLSLVDSLVTN